MMSKLIVLDLARTTGIAVFEDDFLSQWGTARGRTSDSLKISNKGEITGNHPWDMIELVNNCVLEIMEEIINVDPDEILIEQTNLGRNRFSQKFLEWLHYALLNKIKEIFDETVPVYYIDTSEWRRLLKISLSSEDKRHNKLVRLKKANGKITIKDKTIDYVNKVEDMNFTSKDDDIADAICMGLAFLEIRKKGDEYLKEKAERKILSQEKRKKKNAKRKEKLNRK
jgi:hypothetical protein